MKLKCGHQACLRCTLTMQFNILNVICLRNDCSNSMIVNKTNAPTSPLVQEDITLITTIHSAECNFISKSSVVALNKCLLNMTDLQGKGINHSIS